MVPPQWRNSLNMHHLLASGKHQVKQTIIENYREFLTQLLTRNAHQIQLEVSCKSLHSYWRHTCIKLYKTTRRLTERFHVYNCYITTSTNSSCRRLCHLSCLRVSAGLLQKQSSNFTETCYDWAHHWKELIKFWWGYDPRYGFRVISLSIAEYGILGDLLAFSTC